MSVHQISRSLCLQPAIIVMVWASMYTPSADLRTWHVRAQRRSEDAPDSSLE